MIKSVAVYDIISCRMCRPLYVLCMYIVQLLGITFSSILHVHCVCAPPFFLPAVVSSLTFRNISHISSLLNSNLVKFKNSEKATKFCEIFTLLLSYVVPVKSKVKISQNFVAFSEFMK